MKDDTGTLNKVKLTLQVSGEEQTPRANARGREHTLVKVLGTVKRQKDRKIISVGAVEEFLKFKH